MQAWDPEFGIVKHEKSAYRRRIQQEQDTGLPGDGPLEELATEMKKMVARPHGDVAVCLNRLRAHPDLSCKMLRHDRTDEPDNLF